MENESAMGSRTPIWKRLGEAAAAVGEGVRPGDDEELIVHAFWLMELCFNSSARIGTPLAQA
jgi:hypothetical protein